MTKKPKIYSAKSWGAGIKTTMPKLRLPFLGDFSIGAPRTKAKPYKSTPRTRAAARSTISALKIFGPAVLALFIAAWVNDFGLRHGAPTEPRLGTGQNWPVQVKAGRSAWRTVYTTYFRSNLHSWLWGLTFAGVGLIVVVSCAPLVFPPKPSSGKKPEPDA